MNSNESSKQLKYDCNRLLQGSERELIYYLNYLQEDIKSCKYISGVNYKNLKDIKIKIQNALDKLFIHKINVENLMNDMQDDFLNLAFEEQYFSWIKNSDRACYWLLLNILIIYSKENEREINKLKNEDYINLNSGSMYYSIISWFDKMVSSYDDYDDSKNNIKSLMDDWYHITDHSAFIWVSKINSPVEIDYCFNYIQELGINTIDVFILPEHIDAFILLGKKELIGKKDIIIAFFDYLFLSSRNGILAAENLKMKMANALSSWRNRRNKEGYVDVHFDIKKENIPKLEALKKRLNLMSKKEVVNALIEREYDKKG